MPWVRHALNAALDVAEPEQRNRLAAHLLLGLAFYGYDNNEAVLGHQVIERLAARKATLRWDDAAKVREYAS